MGVIRKRIASKVIKKEGKAGIALWQTEEGDLDLAENVWDERHDGYACADKQQWDAKPSRKHAQKGQCEQRAPRWDYVGSEQGAIEFP